MTQFQTDSKIATAEYKFLQALEAVAEAYDVNLDGLEYAMKQALRDCLKDLEAVVE